MLKRSAAVHLRSFGYKTARHHSACCAFAKFGFLQRLFHLLRPRLNFKAKLPVRANRTFGTYITETMTISPALNTRAHLSPAQIALLPKDKFDDAAVNHLSTLSDSEIEPLLPELLTWLQDPNWPIACVVLPFVLQHPGRIIEPVREILRTDDVEWIYVVLGNVVKELPLLERMKLRVEIERIAREPTREEKGNEIDADAREILDDMEAEKEDTQC